MEPRKKNDYGSNGEYTHLSRSGKGSRNKRKLKRKYRIRRILFVLLILFVGAGAFAAYEFYNLNPNNHFRKVPVVGGNKAVVANGVFNVLLLGSDARPEDTVSHTDTIVLMHVDFNKKEYKMISIPRDTRVYLEGQGYTKLTSAQYITQVNKGTIAGVEETVKIVSELTGLTINYYAETDYRGFRNLVDAIGGKINMNVPFQVTLTHPWNPVYQNKVIKPGYQAFDGEMVVEITHERYSLPGTDYGRQELQKEALVGIAKEVENPANIGKLPGLMKQLPNFLIATNLSTEDMLSFALAAKGFDAKQLQYFQVPGEGQNLYDDVLQADNSQIVINKEELKKTIDANFKN